MIVIIIIIIFIRNNRNYGNIVWRYESIIPWVGITVTVYELQC